MRIRWFGQSSYLLTGERPVFIDPFGDMSAATSRGLEWSYPPIEGVEADLLLAPQLVVPMHYRTEAINFLDPPDAFLDALGAPVQRLDASEAETDALLGTAEAPTVALFAPPRS